jgi:beta-N-acetylhexosaminidase
MSLACITDVTGPVLTLEEKALYRATDPWAFFLFGRSCETPAQVRALCADLREAVGRECLIFIDQEGGRVQRLSPPIWPQFPYAALFGRMWQDDREKALEATYLQYRLMAQLMRECGITADCAPCLDLKIEGGHSVIGDRSFSSRPDIVAALARKAMEGLHAGGVASVVKHVPGHGRADTDSHKALPRVEADLENLSQDISVFKALRDAPMAMTAHVVFDALDQTAPATISPVIVSSIIREQIGFDGLLLTDDLTMKALSQSPQDNAAAAFAAGCDIAVLCNKPLETREAFLAACPRLEGKALARAQKAEAIAQITPEPFDAEAAWARFGDLTGLGKDMTLSVSSDPTFQAYA